jgi:hypothetical protein
LPKLFDIVHVSASVVKELIKFVFEIYEKRFLIYELVKRDFKNRYMGQSTFKTRIKLKELKTIIDLPKDFISPEVEIIILSDTTTRKSSFIKRESKDLGGILHKYANSNLIRNEKDKAWSEIIEEKHGLL